ncbi:MATE family efflux transporter [Streptococcus ruminantium]|uniref:MATE family efflux transporter n=1 Tax=Streptococcus ruminantium TaxID=1917441 RepID=UPI00280FAE3D|nr:MATE family efflux transporter [Streptococcus ruminantium]MDQ8820552.1 MATE family efflux transporter [Streptococcus ruminantium]MDQ8837137.1 MATE family efflux transporter [Streptococcus ruminantium]
MKKQTYKEILTIALPSMAENILQISMGMADSYLVAILGTVALSGVALANNILAVYQAVFIALAAAVSSCLARTVGQNKLEEVGRVIGESLKVTLFISLLLGLLSILAGPSLLAILGADLEVGRTGGLYLILVGGGIVFLALSTTLSAILRSLGQPRLPMYIGLLTNLLNILLSAVSVFIFHAGVAGVAIGTILSRLLACLLLWMRLPVFPTDWTWSIDRTLLELALPATSERLMMRAGDVMVVSLITSLGTTVLAGNAIGETLTQFNYMPAFGVATATLILVARHREDKETIHHIYRTSLSLALVLMFLIAGLIYLVGPSLIGFYTKNSQVSLVSQTVLLYSFLGVPFTAGTLILTALWQGLGNARLPFYSTSCGMWLIRIGIAYILMTVFQIGFHAIWIGTNLDNAFRAGFLYFRYRRKNR